MRGASAARARPSQELVSDDGSFSASESDVAAAKLLWKARHGELQTSRMSFTSSDP